MTKQEYETKLKDLQRQIEELKKVEITESKIWKPKKGENYYVILSNNEVEYAIWHNDEYDNELYEIGNCFKTKEEVEFEKEKRLIRTKFKRYLKEHSCEIKQNFYILAYGMFSKKLEFRMGNSIINDYVASDRETIENAIEFIGGEEIAKTYLFDYIGE